MNPCPSTAPLLLGETEGRFPQAHVASHPLSFLEGAAWMWAIAGGCALLAAFLIWQARRPAGTVIHVHFEQGYGLSAGDPVRLRGIDVGEVEVVALSADLEGVSVEIRLTPAASDLARDGSRFWIERPQVQLGNVRGLDTLVGPKYIGVHPGEGEPRTEFDGVPSPRQFADSESIGITVRFRQGHGLMVGAPVRFRGLSVGEVVDVELGDAIDHVLVHAELDRNAQRLAQAGSQFWIERPEVSVSKVRGLDTLVGGAHLAVMPSIQKGAEQFAFEGLDVAPAEDQTNAGIEVVLESPERFGLKAGSPVLHRGVTIGKIIRVGLATDGSSVESRAFIYAAYQDLVRTNSRFWSNSGVGVEIGLLSGVQLDAESLETIAAGGAAMATPNSPGHRIATGHRFGLAEQAEDEWLEWRPQIAIGRNLLPKNADISPPIRATLRWRRRSFGLMRERQQQVWAHVFDPGRLVCPWEGDLPKEITLEYAGKTIDVAASRLKVLPGDLLQVEGVNMSVVDKVWKSAQMRLPASPENCLLVAGPDTMPLSASRIHATNNAHSWDLDAATELLEDWNGASVIAQSDGKLVGILHWNDGRPSIGLISK